MKRKTKPLLVAALIVSGLATAAAMTPASAAGYQVNSVVRVVGVASWDVLNIRAWPNARSAKVGAAAPYARVWVSRCIAKRRGSDWCKISWMEQTGWVNSRYLNLR